MDFQAIEFDVTDRIATITLNRPESLNAWNNAMAREISHVWETVRDDDSIYVAVIQANGERAFCTGADGKSAMEDGYMWWRKDNTWNTFDPGLTLAPKTHHRCWKPVVAAVNGMCAGGGMYFINEADIIICSDDATFFDPHANINLVSALEPMGMLQRGVPLGDVLRWAVMGNEERISATTALRLGLVTEVVANDALRSRARDIATSIAGRNTKAIQGTIRAIWESIDMNRTTALHNGMAYTHIGNEGGKPGDGPKRPTEIR